MTQVPTRRKAIQYRLLTKEERIFIDRFNENKLYLIQLDCGHHVLRQMISTSINCGLCRQLALDIKRGVVGCALQCGHGGPCSPVPPGSINFTKVQYLEN